MNKLFLFITTLILAFAGPTNAYAGSGEMDFFNRMVDVQRDENGRLVQLMLKNMAAASMQSSQSSAMTAQLLKELDTVKPSVMTASEAKSLSMAGWSTTDIKNFKAATEKLSSPADIKALLNNKDIGDILAQFEKGLNSVFQYNVLAKPGVPGYFHDRKIIDKLIKTAMKAAEKALGNVPGLKVVTFLLNETIGAVEGKRAYCQFAVLYYLEHYPASAMGFTDEEVAFIRSSLYEGQIGWLNFKEVEKAKKNWPTYGNVAFDKQVQKNAGRLEKYSNNYGSHDANFNFSFTSFNNAHGIEIVNTFDKKSRFSGDLSVAYLQDDPSAIMKQRIGLRLTQLAATFLPIPGIALDQLQQTISSYYAHQKITEGALYGYYMSQGMTTEATTILKQSINPFLIYEN
jgi:hypothetical protein